MNFFSVLVSLVVSAVFGGIIGIEREQKGSHAGLRTHVLVTLGSCLIMQVSIRIFEVYSEVATVDPSRIASGVITGIGFLGAGAIMRSTQSIKGLTTAASIWVAAGIGLAVGCSFYSAAFTTTVITFLVLKFLRKFESYIKKSSKKSKRKIKDVFGVENIS